MNRREMTKLSLAGVLALGLPALSWAQEAETDEGALMESNVIEVQMLNVHPDNKRERMVFVPDVVFAQPGDTIKFVSVDKSHNTVSYDDVLPEGAEGWKSRISQDFEVTLDAEGVYAYKCQPHETMGMIGMVVVGEPVNLEAVKDLKLRGRQAPERFEAQLAKVEEHFAQMDDVSSEDSAGSDMEMSE